MAENVFAPSSQSQNSENESVRFSTPYVGSSVTMGEKKGYMVSLSNANTTNTNGKLMMTSPPITIPSSGRYIDVSREARENLTTPSSKRSRGRPRGSKNKSKLLDVVMAEPVSYMKPILIEIPAGGDVLQSIIKMAWRHDADISVLKASGLVSDVTIRNPISPLSTFTFEGTIQMTSLFGTYVNTNCCRSPSQFITNPACSSFSIFITTNRGQVYGGVVGGQVKAVGVVLVTAALLKKPKFHRVDSTNGNILEVEKEDLRHVGGVITNFGRVAPEHNNNNNIDIVSGYDVMGANSTHLNLQAHDPPHANVNDIEWNHSTRTNNY